MRWPWIAGVGENLLIAGHRRIETDFAIDLARRADGRAGEDRAVFQRQFCGLFHLKHLCGLLCNRARTGSRVDG